MSRHQNDQQFDHGPSTWRTQEEEEAGNFVWLTITVIRVSCFPFQTWWTWCEDAVENYVSHKQLSIWRPHPPALAETNNYHGHPKESLWRGVGHQRRARRVQEREAVIWTVLQPSSLCCEAWMVQTPSPKDHSSRRPMSLVGALFLSGSPEVRSPRERRFVIIKSEV